MSARHTRQQRWTPDEVQRLVEIYPHQRSAEVAVALGRRLTQVYGKAIALGLRKSAAFLAANESGRFNGGTGTQNRFAKGQRPWNKGLAFEAGGRSHGTRFQRGLVPHTWRPIGSDRVSDEIYLQRKISDTHVTRLDYVGWHHLVWRMHDREIPPGHALIFRDGDRTHCDINNLECISRGELMRRNSVHNYGPEIATLTQLRGAITRQINRRNPSHA